MLFRKCSAHFIDLSLQRPVKVACGVAGFHLRGLIELYFRYFYARQALRAKVVFRRRRTERREQSGHASRQHCRRRNHGLAPSRASPCCA